MGLTTGEPDYTDERHWPLGYRTDLRDVLPNRGLLVSMLEQGYIRKQRHPTEPLVIFNYTEKATFDRVWNQATRTCRGLILNEETYMVVARGFPKFFNWNEPSAPHISVNERVYVTDKLDGSLGIRYWQPRAKRWAIATRGSFTSVQALHATEVLDQLLNGYHSFDKDDIKITSLYEIIYPENRIVLDYGDSDTLVAIGGVHIATGEVIPVSNFNRPMILENGFHAAEVFDVSTFGEALKLPPRKNAEGVVVVTAEYPQRMVKIKQSDYVAMHKTIHGLSANVIWERASSGATLDELKWGMPEELWEFIETTYHELTDRYTKIYYGAYYEFNEIKRQLNAQYGYHFWSRKDFAKLATSDGYKHRDLLFLQLDERDISGVVWKKIKPEGDQRPFRPVSEDTA